MYQLKFQDKFLLKRFNSTKVINITETSLVGLPNIITRTIINRASMLNNHKHKPSTNTKKKQKTKNIWSGVAWIAQRPNPPN